MPRKQLIISTLFFIVLAPLCSYLIYSFAPERKYFFASLAFAVCSIIPFFFNFENSNPAARKIVLIATLCAIAVVGRAAFYTIPQFKPVAAIVIIAGAALGAESGFLVGSISIFVSNMFFGQGPWTLWQMLCFGLIGFFAGVIFYKKSFSSNPIYLCLYGFFSLFIIFGGIINFASVLMFSSDINLGTVLASYIGGIWFDFIHAVSTVVFLLFGGVGMIEKINRTKVKYGL